jgi:integrase
MLLNRFITSTFHRTRGPAMFEHFTPLWRGAIEAFFDHIYQISGSEKSRNTYRGTLARFFCDKDRQPDQYSRLDVQNFLDQSSSSPRNRGAPVKAATYCNRLMCINSVYSYFASYEIRLASGEVAPIFADRLPPSFGIRYRKADAPYRSLNEEEVVRLFQAIPETTRGIRDRAILTFAFFTTRRRGEIGRLQWRHIEKSTIVDPDGQTRPGYIFHHFDKGKSRVDAMSELPGICYDAIVDMLKAQDRYASIRPDEFVFTPLKPGTGRKDKNRNAPLTDEYLNQILRHYVRLAGLDLARVSFHSLRHAGAAARWREGEKLDSLARVLGHTNIATTSRYLQSIVAPSDVFVQRLEHKYAPLFRHSVASK